MQKSEKRNNFFSTSWHPCRRHPHFFFIFIFYFFLFARCSPCARLPAFFACCIARSSALHLPLTIAPLYAPLSLPPLFQFALPRVRLHPSATHLICSALLSQFTAYLPLAISATLTHSASTQASHLAATCQRTLRRRLLLPCLLSMRRSCKVGSLAALESNGSVSCELLRIADAVCMFAVASLSELETRAELTETEFQQRYAPILRACQRDGDCKSDNMHTRRFIAVAISCIR